MVSPLPALAPQLGRFALPAPVKPGKSRQIVAKRGAYSRTSAIGRDRSLSQTLTIQQTQTYQIKLPWRCLLDRRRATNIALHRI